jgi:hypothetical protein
MPFLLAVEEYLIAERRALYQADVKSRDRLKGFWWPRQGPSGENDFDPRFLKKPDTDTM